MAELFKKHPTLVVGCGGKVIKIFENQEKCEHEVNVLKRCQETDLANHFDGSNLKLNGYSWSKDNLLVMDKAKGIALSKTGNSQIHGLKLLGKLVASRHSKIYNDPNKKNLKLGDFSIEHLFLCKTEKLITYIDPGNSFCIEGDLLDDLSRLLFSISARYRRQPFKANNLQTHFLASYYENLNYQSGDLAKNLHCRYKAVKQKYQNSFNGLNQKSKLLSLFYQYLLTKIVVRKVKPFGKN